MIGGWELSPPLRNRFIHLEWEITTEQYINALNSHWGKGVIPSINKVQHAKLLPEWKLKISAFLKLSPNLIHSSPEDNLYGFASPRTWDFVACICAACELLQIAPIKGQTGSKTFIQLIKGCLGEGVAISFIEFLINLKLPAPDDILDGKETLNIEDLNDGELYIIFGAMNRVLESRFESTDLINSALIYFKLTEAVFQDGRRDLIYVSLKKISKAGLLMKTLAMAQRRGPEKSNEIMKAIQELFSDEGLSEFIDIFEK